MRTFTRISLMVVSVVLLGAGSARASIVETKVPFPFIVQGQKMPAGTYRLDSEGNALELRGEHGNRAAMYVLTEPTAEWQHARGTPALVFQRYEGQYRLDDVWMNRGEGYQVVQQ